MYINEGAEGVVYKYGKDAIKIYKETCFRSRLTEDECTKLGKISTKRVLLPEKLAYDGDKKTFIGYSTPFIYAHPVGRIMDMKIDKFAQEIEIIQEDFNTLACRGIEVDDLHLENVLFDGRQIFLGDPGGMYFCREVRPVASIGNNVFTFNRFLIEEIFPLAKLPKTARKNIDTVFYDLDFMHEKIKETALEKETVRQYVKRMTR